MKKQINIDFNWQNEEAIHLHTQKFDFFKITILTKNFIKLSMTWRIIVRKQFLFILVGFIGYR
jgi:hypothetical protein